MLKVLRDRNYPVEKSDFIDFGEFVEWSKNHDEPTVRKDMTLQYEKISTVKNKNTPSNKIIVMWPIENKLGTNIREILIELESLGVSRAIIIINDSVTNWGKGFINSLRIEKTYIDIYTLAESQFNVMEHILVPDHKVCSNIEKKRVLASYSVKQDEIPQIKLSGPIIRHLGATRGQLIKITRISETQPGHECVTYRIVR